MYGRLPEREHGEAPEWLNRRRRFLRSTLASCSWLSGVEGSLRRTDELRLRFDVFSSILDPQAVIIRYFLTAKITYGPLLEQPTHTRPSTPAGVEATSAGFFPLMRQLRLTRSECFQHLVGTKHPPSGVSDVWSLHHAPAEVPSFCLRS